jgi:hypothetical protein
MIVPGASSTLDIELDDATVLGLDQTRILAIVRHDEAIGGVQVARSLGHAAVLAYVIRGPVDERTALARSREIEAAVLVWRKSFGPMKDAAVSLFWHQIGPSATKSRR